MIDVAIRLRRAVYVDNLLIVKRILKNNPKTIHNPDAAGNTSLHLAASHGRTSIVRYLVDAGHESDGSPSRNNAGDTPLLAASIAGHEDVVRFLASRFHAAIDSRNRAGVAAIMGAAMAGRESVVGALLDLGADSEVTDGLGNTALHYACAYGHLKVMRKLVEQGASVDRPNRQGWTPVSYSCTMDAEMYFRKLVQEREILWIQAGGVEKEMVAPVPGFVRSEWMAAAAGAVGVGASAGRQRASSGS